MKSNSNSLVMVALGLVSACGGAVDAADHANDELGTGALAVKVGGKIPENIKCIVFNTESFEKQVPAPKELAPIDLGRMKVGTYSLTATAYDEQCGSAGGTFKTEPTWQSSTKQLTIQAGRVTTVALVMKANASGQAAADLCFLEEGEPESKCGLTPCDSTPGQNGCVPPGSSTWTVYIENHSKCQSNTTGCYNGIWGDNECNHPEVSADELKTWWDNQAHYETQGVRFFGGATVACDPSSVAAKTKVVRTEPGTYPNGKENGSCEERWTVEYSYTCKTSPSLDEATLGSKLFQIRDADTQLPKNAQCDKEDVHKKAIAKVLEKDSKLDAVAKVYGLPQEALQAVLYRENRCKDWLKDGVLEPNGAALLGYDLSTGIANIQTTTAIAAGQYCQIATAANLDATKADDRKKMFDLLATEDTSIEYLGCVLHWERNEGHNDPDLVKIFTANASAGTQSPFTKYEDGSYSLDNDSSLSRGMMRRLFIAYNGTNANAVEYGKQAHKYYYLFRLYNWNH